MSPSLSNSSACVLACALSGMCRSRASLVRFGLTAACSGLLANRSRLRFSSLDSCRDWRAFDAAGHACLASLRLHRTGIRVPGSSRGSERGRFFRLFRRSRLRFIRRLSRPYRRCCGQSASGSNGACLPGRFAPDTAANLFLGLRHDLCERAIRGSVKIPARLPAAARPCVERACLRLEISSQSGCPSRELEARRGRFRILSKEGRPCDAPFPS